MILRRVERVLVAGRHRGGAAVEPVRGCDGVYTIARGEDDPGAHGPNAMRQTAFMSEHVLSVPPYNPRTGVIAQVEGGTIIVEIRDGSVEIFGDPPGLRDLARWCLALADAQAPPGAHVHLDPGTVPLDVHSAPMMLARHRR